MSHLCCLGGFCFSSYLDADKGNRDDVDAVKEYFEQAWIAVVAEEPFENTAQVPVFMEQGIVAIESNRWVNVPNVLDDYREHACFLKLMKAVSYQTGGKEDQHDVCSSKELVQVQSYGSDHQQVAEQNGPDYSYEGANQAVLTAGKLGGAEKYHRLDAFPQDGQATPVL